MMYIYHFRHCHGDQLKEMYQYSMDIPEYKPCDLNDFESSLQSKS